MFGVMLTTTYAAARETLRRLGRSSLDPQSYLDEVSALVRRTVPHDVSGWMTLDPDTLLSSGTLVAQKSPELDRALWRSELEPDGDVHKLAELSVHPSPVVALHELDDATVAESPRIQGVLRPAGIGDGLRTVLRVGGSTWGHGAIYREAGARDFDRAEQEFLAAIAEDIGEGLRRSLCQRPEPGLSMVVPSVLAFDLQGRQVSATAEASRLMTLMPGDATSTLYAVAVGAGLRESASARVRLADGRWLLVHGGRMHGGPDEPARVTVTLLQAPRPDLTSLLLRLHTLSARQREVAGLLISGLRTAEIAAHLHIAQTTLHDHVKAIFVKFGVQGRAELMAILSD
ncbi:LuxR family transcriptional regulator [Kribbella pittospori]|uniref:LuxR family transcriptional regulator n=1 Tax=Kribbella pittospori TaxID=722689 RepID=A0A4R0JYG1_9ACTN|nr:helix-turn-helix transcriptional regulator [Kribbella pittospori]TCC50396.1 LuxR family transcriptional regulator [Kribbella pittospori]